MTVLRERLRRAYNQFREVSGQSPRFIWMTPALFAQFESELMPMVRETAAPANADEERYLLFKDAKVYAKADAPPDSIYLFHDPPQVWSLS